jgi:broad specificity phosphatase PhoE
MTKIVIVRHGQSALNVSLDFMVGNQAHDTPFSEKNVHLTEQGIVQAKHVGDYLHRYFRFGACYCSPFVRAEETADHVLQQCNVSIDPTRDIRLSEKKFGDLYGFTAEAVRKYHPEEYNKREQLGRYWYRPPNGENYEDVKQRIRSFMDWFAQTHNSEDALVVTHQVPYKMIYADIAGLSDKDVEQLKPVPNCSVQLVELNGNGFTIADYNLMLN